MASALRYVALGDSYTIGTSVLEGERWPNQLVARVSALDLVANLGVNGYTSGDVIRDELRRLPALRPDFVSLLVGVNDVVRGVPIDAFRANTEVILDRLLTLLPAHRVLLVSTPDYTVTPAGGDYGDPSTQSAKIRRNNAVLEELTRSRSIPFVDIFHLSLLAAEDRSLVARDGLHPSGKQYALWVERIAPLVKATLESSPHG